MSSQAMLSNKADPLLISLTNGPTKNLAYGLEESLPNGVKSVVVANCKTNVGNAVGLANKEITIDVTRAGFWCNGMIETGLYPTADLTVAGTLGSGAIGLVLYGDIQLKSTNRTIYTQSDAYCLARTQSSPVAKAMAIYRRAHFLNTVAGSIGNIVALPLAAGHYSTFTPLFIPFFESQRNHVDLRMAEPLSLVCRFNSDVGMGIPSAVTMLADDTYFGCTAKLHQYMIEYEQDVTQQLAIDNWSIDKPLEYLAVNSISGTATSSTTLVGSYYNHTVKIPSTVPAIATYVYLRRKSTFTATSLADCAQAIAFDKFTVKLNNVTLFEDITKLVGTFEGESGSVGGLTMGSGASSGSVTVINGNILKIVWSKDQQNKMSFTGALAFGGINNPEVTLKSTTIGTDIEIVWCNELLNNWMLNGADGSIKIST